MAGVLVLASVHDAADLRSRSTAEDCIGFLGMTYLVPRLPAWSRNLSAKAKPHPRIYVADTGLPRTS
jgi:uncharacterized protein